MILVQSLVCYSGVKCVQACMCTCLFCHIKPPIAFAPVVQSSPFARQIVRGRIGCSCHPSVLVLSAEQCPCPVVGIVLKHFLPPQATVRVVAFDDIADVNEGSALRAQLGLGNQRCNISAKTPIDSSPITNTYMCYYMNGNKIWAVCC